MGKDTREDRRPRHRDNHSEKDGMTVAQNSLIPDIGEEIISPEKGSVHAFPEAPVAVIKREEGDEHQYPGDYVDHRRV